MGGQQGHELRGEAEACMIRESKEGRVAAGASEGDDGEQSRGQLDPQQSWGPQPRVGPFLSPTGKTLEG